MDEPTTNGLASNVAEQQVSTNVNIDNSAEDTIATALSDFRAQVLAQNRPLVELIVRHAIEEELSDPDEDIDPSEVLELRMSFIEQYTGIGPRHGLGLIGVEIPEDVLERLDDCVSLAQLDGVYIDTHIPGDERVRKRHEFLEMLLAELRRRAVPPEVANTLALPRGFVSILQHVDSVISASFGFWRMMHQPWFIEGVNSESNKITERVYGPEELVERVVVDDPAEVAVGWLSGYPSNSGVYVYTVYRRETSDSPWKWQYIVREEGGVAVFDDIPTILEWVLRFRPTMRQDVKETFNSASVFDP
jgi:hypothetical protein